MEEVAMFTETLVKGMGKPKRTKRKGRTRTWNHRRRVDNGHKRVDWTIRNLLRPINRDPNTY